MVSNEACVTWLCLCRNANDHKLSLSRLAGSVSPWHIFRLRCCAPDGSRVSQMMGIVALSGNPRGFMMNQNLQIFH